MFDYAHQRAEEVLQIPRQAILATSGPAGLQAGKFPIAACGTTVYVPIPQTSDHLFNLENNPRVSLVSDEWEISGEARIVPPCEAAGLAGLIESLGLPDAWLEWYRLVKIDPHRLQIHQRKGWGNTETIDLQPE